MSVHTKLVRNGKPVHVGGGWTWWHLNRLYEAMIAENPAADESQITVFPNTYLCSSPGVYTFKQTHTFEADEKDIWTDGIKGRTFRFVILPGDQYHAWRV